MCGIVGYTGDRAAAPVLLEGLKCLEYRGYDSAGIAVIQERKLAVSKVTGNIVKLYEKTERGRLLPGTTGIGHTRWATHGAPSDVNAHPHVSNDGRFAVVHNGIIENHLQLREELCQKGYHFKSETDTEVIAHLLEMYDAGDVKEAVMRTATRLCGSYALGIICFDEPGRMFVLRNSSPLILGAGAGENYFASDVTALVPYTRNVVYLDDGEFAVLTADSIQVYNCAGRPVQKAVTRITWDIQAAEKGGYEHFMLKEIMEQPKAVEATISPRVQDGCVRLDEIPLSVKDFNHIRKIVITACGSAYYAGCAGKYVIEKLCHWPVQVELASELRYAEAVIDADTLLIVLSQSGETADTIAAMKECQKRGAKALAIVNVVGSTIAKLADYVLYTWAGPEIAVATTKGYTTQLAALYLFALYAAQKLGTVGEEAYKGLLDSLLGLPKQLQQALDMNPGIPHLAKRCHASQSLFFIGRNMDYAAALEGALKMKEISYIHAEACAAGELKHGTIALIHEKQIVIALCCNPQIAEKTMNNIVEVKARGAEVLAVTRSDISEIGAFTDEAILIPCIHPLFNSIVEVIPLQLLAYYVAKENRCDIDKPRNLAKSVTVE